MKPRFPRAISFLSQRYKNRLWVCIGLSTLALLSESIGILSILPIIVVVLGQQDGSAASDPMFQKVEAVLASLSIPINLPLLLVIFFSGILLKACLNLWSLREAGYAAATVAKDIRAELTSGLMRASWPHFINLRIGEITNLIVGEPDRVAYSFPALVKFVSAIFQVLLYTALSFYASPAVAITAFIIGSIIFLCLRRLIRIHQHVATEQAKERGVLADRVTQILNGFKIIKAMALEPWVQPLLTEGTEKLGTLYRKEVLSKAALQSVFEPTFALCLCLGIVIFTIIYPQPLAQLMFMAILLHRLMSHMSTLQASYQNLTGYDGIIDQYLKHKDSLHLAAEEEQSTEPLSAWRDLALENISFSYGTTSVLKDISADFPARSLTVILGPSGTGKSTLLDVLAGLQKPTQGRVLLDKSPLTYNHLYSYRKHLGYLPQEPILLNDTIRRNITLGDNQFSDNDIAEALQNAGLTQTVATFPEGMETIVGERGGRLSGGQRQRLMLARALIRKPSLLLLDEPLSALDAETALALCNTLSELKTRLAIVAVSHQQDILRVADHVYEMDKGQIRKI